MAFSQPYNTHNCRKEYGTHILSLGPLEAKLIWTFVFVVYWWEWGTGMTDAHKEKRRSRIKERMKLGKDVASAGAWHQPDRMGALQCDWNSRAHPTHRDNTQTQVRRKRETYLSSMWRRQLLWT